MEKLESKKNKKLTLNADYEVVYTSKVKSNGGNSAKINCKREFLNKEVIVFVLKGGKDIS